VKRRLRLAKPTKIVLALVWGIAGLFILGDLGEIVRGDSSFNADVGWNLLGGITLTAVALAVQAVARRARGYFAKPS
jgi:hypothetical protein